MKDVYKVEDNKQIKIEEGRGRDCEPYYFESLDAAPGDLIRIICYDKNRGTYGAGCFVLNNNCHCFNFDSNISRVNYRNVTRSHPICSMSGIQFIIFEECPSVCPRNYTYEQRIPLDVSNISCKNTDNVSFAQHGENVTLNLTNYIIADFELKNLEVIIKENYKYFYLNDSIQLIPNQKFKILSELKFNSQVSKKLHIIFENQGIVLNNTKECSFYIRVCHEGCLQCLDEDITEKKHQCTKCKDGFYFVENTDNCKRRQEMDLTKYYLNETSKMFMKTETDCKTNLDNYLEEYITDDYFDTTDIENGNNEIIKCEDMSIILTTTKNQKDPKNNINKTIIDFSECEDILKNEYNMSENEFIYMKKIELYEKGMKIPKIVFDLYKKENDTNLMKLDLSFCSNVKRDILSPIDLNNENLDKYNSSSDYYNNLCYKATSDSGTDINLNDRKNEYLEKNMSVCQESCFFSEYDYNTKRAKCSCDIKESFSSLKDIKIDKNNLFNNLIDIKNIGNIGILPCYKVLFCKEGIIKNYGSYFIIFIFLFHIILIILFFVKRNFKKIKIQINDIKYSIKNLELIKAEKNRRKLEKKNF